MDNLGRFDEGKSTIRLILNISYEHGRPIPRLELFNNLALEGVGRTAAYRSINICKELGLLEDRSYNIDGKRIQSLQLTKKGIELIEPLKTIKNLLDE
jgi:hypothetical protein